MPDGSNLIFSFPEDQSWEDLIKNWRLEWISSVYEFRFYLMRLKECMMILQWGNMMVYPVPMFQILQNYPRNEKKWRFGETS